MNANDKAGLIRHLVVPASDDTLGARPTMHHSGCHRRPYFPLLTLRATKRIGRTSRCSMGEEKSEFLKGTLDMLILKVVALGPIHGYAVAQRIQQISRDFFLLQQGSLYPALHRLEDRGWLKAEWKATETGRDAKFYALTPKGRKQLETEVRNWEQLIDAVALILRTAE
jgi:PadR family transcriptional regulator, regulatory protein PadR